VSQIQGVDSETGQLRTVLMHRPGLELQRITPRHSATLLLRTLPWISKAREEHDVLCEQLRDHGIEVLYFTELLQDALEYQPARDQAIGLALADGGLGDELRGQLRGYLSDLGPEQLAEVLIAGLTPDELKIGRGVVFELLDRHDFVLDPLPNLVFTKDSSFWVGSHVGVARLGSERRQREAGLTTVIYRHHPRFVPARWIYHPGLEHLDGGDVLLLGAGVVAVGVGQHTTPAGAERLARRLFDADLVHTVLAVPTRQLGAAAQLDTLCTVIDVDSVVMHPAVAYALTAHTISRRADRLQVSRPQPFLEAAAQAMGIDRLRVIDSGTEPAWGQSGRWDDGGNVLAIAPRVAVSHERNSETNARLEAAGVQVIRVPGSELGSLRGGPRCMTCPIDRYPAPQPADKAEVAPLAALARQGAVLAGHEVAMAGLVGGPRDPLPVSQPGAVPDMVAAVPEPAQLPEPVRVPASAQVAGPAQVARASGYTSVGSAAPAGANRASQSRLVRAVRSDDSPCGRPGVGPARSRAPRLRRPRSGQSAPARRTF
jgi:arginine deiminase